jgi:hypothetical protein
VREEPITLAADHSPATPAISKIYGTFTAQSGKCPMVTTWIASILLNLFTNYAG